jgi:phenylacetate-coenzyme A ligase PaaK-like adenylate-forming protein
MMVPEYSPEYRRRCREVVDAALGEIPIYEKWAAFDVGGDDPFARLSALPLVDKALMRKHGPACLVAPKADLSAALARGEVEIVHTSGSTGDRVSNVWCQAWWNASEQASWQLNAHARLACDGGHPEAILASPLCVGFPCEDGFLARAQRTLGRFLFLNERVDPNGWTPEHMSRMVEELNDFQPAVLEGSPSYLGHLCRFAARGKAAIHSPELIVLTFENASILHRRQIQAVFDSPIASSYGATEAGYVFMECECGRLHQNTAFCHVDFIPFSSSQGGPEIGSILVTTFRNPWRVLLRFDIGDVVRLAKEPCPCGRRAGLTLAGIEGRAVNLTVTPEGCAVTQDEVDRAVGGLPGIDEYQLVQVSERGYCLKFICQAADERSIASRLRSVLAAIYGKNAQICLERVASIALDPPGKYRLAKPLIPVNPRAFWDPRYAPPENPAALDGEGGEKAS